MREVLEALAAGDLSVAEAEAKLAGYATTEAGRFDVARERRRGVPEAILAEGKTPGEVVDLVQSALETVGRAIVTRADDEVVDEIRSRVPTDADLRVRERAGFIEIQTAEFDIEAVDAEVVIVAGGTSDRPLIEEAAGVLESMGVTVSLLDDVGVAGIHRLLSHIETIRTADVAIVAAGREGALPTVVAGLVDTPVIGLPGSTGYGHGGGGEAALLGMLQSCSVLSVVNIDAGFVAGAQAGLIATAIGRARAASG